MGIPLSVVVDGIDRVFDRPKTALAPRRLSYCRQTVEAQFRKYREAALGQSPATEEDASFPSAAKAAAPERWVSVGEHLSALAAKLSQAAQVHGDRVPRLAEELLATSTELEKLRELQQMGGVEPEGSARELEVVLTEAEGRILQHAETHLGEVSETLREEAESAISEYRGRMPDEVFRAACRSAFLRRLRRHIGIPPLSLFDR